MPYSLHILSMPCLFIQCYTSTLYVGHTYLAPPPSEGLGVSLCQKGEWHGHFHHMFITTSSYKVFIIVRSNTLAHMPLGLIHSWGFKKRKKRLRDFYGVPFCK
jgi:hypothetical protein